MRYVNTNVAVTIFGCFLLAMVGLMFVTGAGVNGLDRFNDWRAGSVSLTALETTKAITGRVDWLVMTTK